MDRNLDGVYFRVKREDRWCNISFTDLTDEEAERVLDGRSEKWMRSLCDRLEEVLIEIKKVINSQAVDAAVNRFFDTMCDLPLKDRTFRLKNAIKNLGDYYDLGIYDNE